MKSIIALKYILPVIIFFFFSFKSTNSQIEIDTSKMGPPSTDPSMEDFKDSLSKNGSWIKVDENEIDPNTVDGEDSVVVDDDINTEYVWVPSPALIYVDWNPYCYGQWVWTFWGWQWVPYDNWGWGGYCTYHYGRWWHSDHYGWCWSPGRRWRHSWTSWCNSGAYWGWHPLSPRVHYRRGVAVLPIKNNEKNDGWVFVNKKDFKKPIDKTKIVDINKHNEILKNANQNLVTKNQRTKISDPKSRVQNSRKIDNGKKNQNVNRNRNVTRIDPKGPGIKYKPNNGNSNRRNVTRGNHNNNSSGKNKGNRSSDSSKSNSNSKSDSNRSRK